MVGTSQGDGSGPASVTSKVVLKVAHREGVGPLELDTPLYEAIDPEALEALVRASTSREHPGDIRVQFPYYGYEVEVRGTGDVDVSDVESTP